jgi:hypothetical protein
MVRKVQRLRTRYSMARSENKLVARVGGPHRTREESEKNLHERGRPHEQVGLIESP